MWWFASGLIGCGKLWVLGLIPVLGLTLSPLLLFWLPKTLKVVVSRRNVGVRKWTNWLREDLGSWP